MADHFLPPGLENTKHSFTLSETDPNIDQLINNFSVITNPIHHQQQHQPFGLNILDNIFPHLLESPGLFIHHDNNLMPHITTNDSDNYRDMIKRKLMETSSPVTSSFQDSDDGIRRRNGVGRGKRVKSNDEKKDEKLKEVVHVRAKRGQATDSHSLAERVRREKINERLRCLQDIVPGCYKTMGMAVMLDEIINYVQSLQNQVEFLSMKLTVASTCYDFNSDTDTLEAMQRAKAFEALKIQNGVNPGLNSAQFAPLDLNFGCYPQLPHNN